MTRLIFLIGLTITMVNCQSYFDVNYTPSGDLLQDLQASAGQAASAYDVDAVKQGGFAFLQDIFNSLLSTKKSQGTTLLESRSDGLTGFLANDLEGRILNVRQEIKDSIPGAVRSVEADIAASNRDNGILALTNFLGAFSGALDVYTGSNGLGNRGDQVLFWAQVLYGYGYTFSWLDNFEDANLSCGRADFEAAEPTYAFLDYNPHVDAAVKKYFLTEQASRYKKVLYCIISRRGSNSEAKKIDKLIDLHKDLQSEKFH